MPGLGKYVNSDYLFAANRLNGKNSCRRVVAYVESYDDVFFWRSILSQLETPDIRFQIMLPTKGRRLGRGKKAALMSALKDNMGPDMIACVDADYDYLKQGADAMSETVCHNKYIFHTYAYAIENLQCWAPALREVCVMATLNDYPDIMDFEGFLKSYSETIYPLFVWSVLGERRPELCSFRIPDLLVVVKTGTVTKRCMQETLKRVGDRVKTKLGQLYRTTKENVHTEYDKLSNELASLGVRPEETYLYIQGHHLFDQTVVPMLTAECNFLIAQREREIRTQSKHYVQSQNEISSYEHSLETVSSMLKKNTLYLHSPQVQRIFDDISSFIKDDLKK